MGIFKKEKEYGKDIDLDELSDKIENYLKDDKWQVQSLESEKGKIIQARKDGILREIFAADRALIIALSKTTKGFKVEMGVGKWIQNIAVTVVESVLLTSLFLVIDVPEMLWNAQIENRILKKIDDFVAEIVVAGEETKAEETKGTEETKAEEIKGTEETKAEEIKGTEETKAEEIKGTEETKAEETR